MSVWLEAVATPLPERPCGEDPRYWDEFVFIKGEIEKLQGADFARVWDLGRELLATRTRDLRVAGYLVAAGLFTGGAPRLLEAVRGYRLLAERFFDDCHPRQDAARVAALRWLNQPKIESLARRYATGASREEVEALGAEIGIINGVVREKFGEDAPLWTILNPWMQETLHPPVDAPPRVDATGARLPAAPPPSEMAAALSDRESALASDREMAAAARSIRDYLRAQGQELQAAYFARALRWGGLAPPPHDGGKTRIPPPGRAGITKLKKPASPGTGKGYCASAKGSFWNPGGSSISTFNSPVPRLLRLSVAMIWRILSPGKRPFWCVASPISPVLLSRTVAPSPLRLPANG